MTAAIDDADLPLHVQLARLEQALATNPKVVALLQRAPELGLPDWYLGAGAICGTVWNVLHGLDPTHGIKDYDLVYFDADDGSEAAEAEAQRRGSELVADLDLTLDVTNEARVHEWYAERFGKTIPPYRSSEHAISTWPTTATSIGVRDEGGRLVVCAPFGLHDLFSLCVRPNYAKIDRGIYEAKAARWSQEWPELRVLPWRDE